MSIPFFGIKKQYQNIKHEILDVTDQVLSSGEVMDGNYTEILERWLRDRIGCDYAVTVHSGTQALEIIAMYYSRTYCRIVNTVDTTVLIPNISYKATLHAFLNHRSANQHIELVDTDNNGLFNPHAIQTNNHPNQNVDEIREIISCIVGLYGAVPDLNSIISNVGTCPLIVDGAHHWLALDTSLPMKIRYGNAMAISFDPTKNLNGSGNGGAIITDNQDLYQFAKAYKSNFGTTIIDPCVSIDLYKYLFEQCDTVYEKEKDKITTIATNSRMSELECAHVMVRTRYIDQWQERRKTIRYYYISRFANLPIRCLSDGFADNHADHRFVIQYTHMTKLQQFLSDNGIETKRHYPYTLSEIASGSNVTKCDFMTTSVMLAQETLSLPLYPELTDAEVEFIADTVCDYFS